MKDSNAINIDQVQLSKNQREEYLQEEKYFNYGKKEHISQNYNIDRNSNRTQRPRNNNNWNNN